MGFNQLITNMMLGKLKNTNPEAYQEVVKLMNSGKDPNTVLNELLASGRFSQNDINKAQNLASQYLNGNNKGKRF